MAFEKMSKKKVKKSYNKSRRTVTKVGTKGNKRKLKDFLKWKSGKAKSKIKLKPKYISKAERTKLTSEAEKISTVKSKTKLDKLKLKLNN